MEQHQPERHHHQLVDWLVREPKITIDINNFTYVSLLNPCNRFFFFFYCSFSERELVVVSSRLVCLLPQGMRYVNGYDDVEIVAGTGTIGMEILEQVRAGRCGCTKVAAVIHKLHDKCAAAFCVSCHHKTSIHMRM